MLKFIINLFSSKSAASLAKQSANVVDVFTATVKQLTSINEKAQGEITKKDAEIVKLKNEQSSLALTVEKNTAVVNKLTAIFE